MTIMSRMRKTKSLQSHALDSESGRIKMGVTFFPLGSGSYPTPPPRAGDGDRERETETGFELYGGLDSGFPTFAHAKNFDELEDERERTSSANSRDSGEKRSTQRPRGDLQGENFADPVGTTQRATIVVPGPSQRKSMPKIHRR
jgi:hypothetical protein